MKRIDVGHGQRAVVDDRDFAIVDQWRWYARRSRPNATWYASATIKGKTVYMHRLLSGAGPDQQVDHRNGNGLDNRRSNLRLCTASQNQRNKRATASSGLRGVYRNRSRWQVKLRINGKVVSLGTFNSKRLAALVYDAAAKFHLGDFARPNFYEAAP